MLSEKSIKKINQSIEDSVFNYTGDFITTVGCDVDFKIELLGYRNMIRVGETYPHMSIKVIFLKFKDDVTELVFRRLKEVGKDKTLEFVKKNYSLRIGIENYVSSVLSFFDNENNSHVVIDDVEIKHEFEDRNPIQEQRMNRQTTRQVVRDIVNVLKKGKSGDFYLPDTEGEMYSLTKYPVEFTVELSVKKSKKIEGFKIDANYIPDEDVIEIFVTFNPQTLTKNLYDIVGELNEIVAHELEHSVQSYKGEFDGHDEDDVENSLEYYTQSHEIPAQVKGFRRLSSLRKQPFEQIVRNWFDTHEDIHNLGDDEQEEVIGQILDYNQTI
jgi:hypothetical protein